MEFLRDGLKSIDNLETLGQARDAVLDSGDFRDLSVLLHLVGDFLKIIPPDNKFKGEIFVFRHHARYLFENRYVKWREHDLRKILESTDLMLYFCSHKDDPHAETLMEILTKLDLQNLYNSRFRWENLLD